MRTFTSRALAFGSTATLVALVACGDDDSSAPAAPPSDATMTALSEALCQKYAECTSDYAMQIGYPH